MNERSNEDYRTSPHQTNSPGHTLLTCFSQRNVLLFKSLYRDQQSNSCISRGRIRLCAEEKNSSPEVTEWVRATWMVDVSNWIKVLFDLHSRQFIWKTNQRPKDTYSEYIHIYIYIYKSAQCIILKLILSFYLNF